LKFGVLKFSVAALILTLLGATSAVAASDGVREALGLKKGVITACVVRGALKIDRCPKGAKKISWNARGPAGRSTRGAVGARGAQGVQGQSGPQGQKGDKGDKGEKGDKGDKGDTGTSADQPRVVTDGALQGWQLLPRGTNPDPTDNGVIAFRADGPRNTDAAPKDYLPPLGAGSLKFASTNGKNVSAIVPLGPGNPGTATPSTVDGLGGPSVADLTTATFASYVATQPQPGLDVAFKVVVLGANTGTTSGFTTLVFEPVNNAAQGTTELGRWHRWYPSRGNWWSTRALASGKCQNAAGPTGWCTLAQFVADNPNAVIASIRLEIGQNSGAGWSGFEGYVDDVRLGLDGIAIRYDLGA
jgi:hypothetical protein